MATVKRGDTSTENQRLLESFLVGCPFPDSCFPLECHPPACRILRPADLNPKRTCGLGFRALKNDLFVQEGADRLEQQPRQPRQIRRCTRIVQSRSDIAREKKKKLRQAQ